MGKNLEKIVLGLACTGAVVAPSASILKITLPRDSWKKISVTSQTNLKTDPVSGIIRTFRILPTQRA